MTGHALLVGGFFLALMASQPVAYLLAKWVETTEAGDQFRSRTPGGSINVDARDPQAPSTPWVGVEPTPVVDAPPAHPNLVPAVDAVPPQSAAGTKPPQSPVGAAARTQLLRSPDSSSPPSP